MICSLEHLVAEDKGSGKKWQTAVVAEN